jgi:integrase
MPKMNLTQTAVDHLQRPAEKAVTWWDAGLPGFGCRISPLGKKVWVAMYEVRGKSILETIAPVKLLPKVAEARERARISILKARDGIDPRQEKRQQEVEAAAEAAARAFNFERLSELFVERYLRHNTRDSSCRETARLLRRAGEYFKAKPVRDIRKADVLELVAQGPVKATYAGLVEAGNILKATKRAFKWGVEQDLVAADPTVGVRKPLAKKTERDRVLDDDELVALWHGADSEGWPKGRAIQLLILLGQRRDEVAEAPWSEFDLTNRVWHLPANRVKNGRAHTVHLSDMAMSLLEGLPRNGPYLFAIGGKPVSGFAEFKRRLDAMMPAGTPHWVLHDIRRTVATNMQRLGIRLEVTEAALNHISGSRGGIVGIYQRFNYVEERRAALDAWANFVATLIDPERGRKNVIQFAGLKHY